MYGTLSNKQPPDTMKYVCLQGYKRNDSFDQLSINKKATTIRSVGILGMYNAQDLGERKDWRGANKTAHGMGEGS